MSSGASASASPSVSSLDFRPSLSSSHFVVLGGTGNVGSGVVAAALNSSALVVVVSRTADKFALLKSNLEKFSIPTTQLRNVVGDFRNETEANEVAKKCFTECNGRIDHIVSNLGFGHLTQAGPTASNSSVKDILTNFEDGLFNTYLAAKAFIPLLREQKSDVSYTISQGASQHDFLYMVQLWAGAMKQKALNALFIALLKENENFPQLRINAVCIHLAVAAIGQTKNQWQYDGIDTRELAPVYLALASNKNKKGQNVCVEINKHKEVAEKIFKEH